MSDCIRIILDHYCQGKRMLAEINSGWEQLQPSRKHIWHSHQVFFHWFLSFHWQRMNSVCGLQKNSEFNRLSTTKNIQMSSFCISYFNDICDESASLVSVLIVCCPGLADWVSSAAGHPGTYLAQSFCFMGIDMFFKNNLLGKRIEAL